MHYIAATAITKPRAKCNNSILERTAIVSVTLLYVTPDSYTAVQHVKI